VVLLLLLTTDQERFHYFIAKNQLTRKSGSALIHLLHCVNGAAFEAIIDKLTVSVPRFFHYGIEMIAGITGDNYQMNDRIFHCLVGMASSFRLHTRELSVPNPHSHAGVLPAQSVHASWLSFGVNKRDLLEGTELFVGYDTEMNSIRALTKATAL
jgi:hypothetical protein